MMGCATGTVFDTAGHNITVKTSLKEEEGAKIVKQGAGTLHLEAANEVSGTMSVQGGTLQLSGTQAARHYEIQEGATLSLTHGDSHVDVLSVSGGGVLLKNSAGDMNMGAAALQRLSLKGGGVSSITGAVSVAGQLSIGRETVNLLEGAVVTANQLTAGNEADYSPSTINIDGGELRITGTANEKTTSASLLLAHWKQSATVMNLNAGKLVAANTIMYTSWDTAGTFRALGGEAELLGINLQGQLESRSGSFELGTQDAGTAVVCLGGQGIKGIVGTASVTLGNGRLAAADDFSIEGANGVSLVGTNGGTTFDTAGHSITMSTPLRGSGKLTKTGAGSLLLNGSVAQYNGAVSVDGGTLVLGTESQGLLTAASSLEVHENGTLDLSAATVTSDMLKTVSCAGTVILECGDISDNNGMGFDFSTISGSVQVNGGRVRLDTSTFGETAPDFILTTANSQLVFNGNGTVVKGNVVARATEKDESNPSVIHVNEAKSGEIAGTVTGTSIVKDGSGCLTVSSKVNLEELNAKAGEFKITYAGADGNTIGYIDAGMYGAATGKLVVGEGVKVQTDKIRMRPGAAIELEKGGQLFFGQMAVRGESDAANAVMERTPGASGDYSGLGDANMALRNARVICLDTVSSPITANSLLDHSSIENASQHKLTVMNSNNVITGVVASGGDMAVLNQGALSLDILDVAGGKTVGLYTGADTASEKAAATVSGTAAFGTGAVLNTACLTLADGATLEMSGLEAGAVTLSGALTFGSGLKLGEFLLASVGALDYGETLNLFTGLSGVNLPVVVDTESSRVLASSVFSNVQSDTLYVDYRVIDNVGTLLVANVPEPATATLSLMALAALAARRRRK